LPVPGQEGEASLRVGEKHFSLDLLFFFVYFQGKEQLKNPKMVRKYSEDDRKIIRKSSGALGMIQD